MRTILQFFSSAVSAILCGNKKGEERTGSRPTPLKVLSVYFLNVLSTFSLKVCYLLMLFDRVVVRVRTRYRSPSASLLFANSK